MIVAGEASGDLYGAHLVKAVRQSDMTVDFSGIGGKSMRAAGVGILIDASELAVVGITEVFFKIPRILRGLSTARSFLRSERPDLLILIDFPDFNLRLAATAKRLGIKVLYYISPQIWAWRSWRVKKIKRLVDHMAVIFPFDTPFYESHGIPVPYVGHPLLDTIEPVKGDSSESAAEDAAVVGLMPGSRNSEITRHLPIMLDAAGTLIRRYPHMKFIIPVAPTVGVENIQTIIREKGARDYTELVINDSGRAFRRCRLAVVASGTVTLEAALYRTPIIIIYKVSPISYLIGRALINVDFIGMVNLIAGQEVAPELIQKQADPAVIADHLSALLEDKRRLALIKQQLDDINAKLGGSGASLRVADIALNMLKEN